MIRPSLTLGIETSSRLVGVALLENGRLAGSLERLTTTPKADDLRQMVEAVLADARRTLDDVTGIAVSIGPGSFTGLRISASFVKGLTAGRRLPVIGVSTLDVIAHNLWGARGTIIVLVDAKQGKVYAAAYRGTGRGLTRLGAPQLGTIESLHPRLARGTLFVGDGLTVYGTVLRRQLKRALQVVPEELWWPRAATVARLGAQALASGRRDDPRCLTPLYLYPSDCTIQKKVR